MSGLNFKELQKKVLELEKEIKFLRQSKIPALNKNNQLELTDLISIEILQKLQDGFAESYNMPSIIYGTKGAPITKPSRFTQFCKFVRSTPKGNKNCIIFDSELINKLSKNHEPCIRKGCALQNIITGTVPIIVEGNHLANFSIGQLIDKDFDFNEIKKYAHEIEVDEKELLEKAKTLIPVSNKDFEAAVKFINTLAEHIGYLSEQKLQQNKLIVKQKQVEETLQKERNLFSDGPVCTIVWGPSENWPVRYVSENIVNILGYTPTEMMNSDFKYSSLIHEEDLERIESEVTYNMENAINVYEQSYRLRTKSGEFKWFYDFTKIIRNKDRSILEIRGYVFDQSALKQVEEKTEEQKQRLKYILRGTNVGTWEWNIQTNETKFNERWAEIIGYTLEEISPVSVDTWLKFTNHDDNLMSNYLLERHFKGELDYYECEARMRHKNGNWVWVLDRGKVATWTDEGKPLLMSGTHQDITERKQAEEALQESRTYLSYIFKNVPVGIMIINSKKREIVDVNPYVEKLIGLSKQEILGHICHQFVCTANRGECPILDLGQKIDNIESVLLKSDGTQIPVIKTATKATLKNKTYLIEILYDISERKQAEKEKSNLEAQLQQAQKIEAIGTLAGGMAHDFNNLLTIINGYSEMVLLQIGKENPLYEEITSIHQAGKRAESLISQLLAFSRKQIYKTEIVEINKVISSMDKILRRLIDEDIDIETVFTFNLPNIKADKSQLEQIFVNLVINARDAVIDVKKPDFKKKITIETGKAKLNENYISKHPGSQQGEHIFFSVSDNGIGIDKETKVKIFEPFFTTKEKYKGTGLGLSMVYGIVRQNKGSIYVYSEPGEGTMFKIYWPVTEEEKKDKAIFEEKVKLSGSEKILIVEDNAEVSQFATEALSSLGYDITKSANGREALEIVKSDKEKFDLIITDLIMPELNGKEFIEEVEKIFPDVKVIYTSGYTDNHIVHNGLLVEGVNFINKPFTLKTLSSMVRQVLDDEN